MPTPLHRILQRRPWVVWLVVGIAVLGALAPTLTHGLMLAHGQAVQSVEICTAQGSRWVSVGAATSGATATANADADADAVQEPSSTSASEHCQFCLQTTASGVFFNEPLLQPMLVPDGPRAPPASWGFFYATKYAFAPPPRGPPGLL